MTNDLMARAARESRKEKLRRYPRLSKDAAKLAAAVGVLPDALEHVEHEEQCRWIWYRLLYRSSFSVLGTRWSA